MRNLLLILVALTSLSAQARWGAPMPTQDSTWKEISKARRVVFQFPQFAMSRGFFLRLGSVCIDGDNLRSKKELKKCVEWQGRGDRCVKWESTYSKLAMEGTRSICVRRRGGDSDTCVEWKDYPYSIATEYKIPVYKRRSMRDESDYDTSSRFPALFVKDYSLTDCE